MTGVDGDVQTATLAALRTALGQVLGDSREQPTRVVVRCGGASIEVAWTAPVETLREAGPGPVPQPASSPSALSGGVPLSEGTPPPEGAPPPATAAGEVLRAPLVGTFYRAPEPGAPPFAEVGDIVRAGQQVALIEAMKLMNPIEADRDGRVTAVLVDNGVGVEYDQPLFELEAIDAKDEE